MYFQTASWKYWLLLCWIAFLQTFHIPPSHQHIIFDASSDGLCSFASWKMKILRHHIITFSLYICSRHAAFASKKRRKKANSRDCTFMKVFPVSSWLCWTTRASLPTSTFRVRWSCWRCGLVCLAVALIVITGGNRGARRGMLLCTWGLRMNVWGIHRSWAMNSYIFLFFSFWSYSQSHHMLAAFLEFCDCPPPLPPELCIWIMYLLLFPFLNPWIHPFLSNPIH